MTDQEVHSKAPENSTPMRPSRSWDRLATASVAMVLYCIAVCFLMLMLGVTPNSNEARTSFPVYLNVLRLLAGPSFILGTFLASVWVFRELISGSRHGQAGKELAPVPSLLLTARLHSIPPVPVTREIAGIGIVAVFFGAFITGFALSLLWQ